MSENNFKSVRHSFTVRDEAVNEWVDKQDNISLSLRLLIRGIVEQTGYQDYPTYLSSLLTMDGHHDTPKVTNKIENRQKEKPSPSFGTLGSKDNNQINFMGTDSQDLP